MGDEEYRLWRGVILGCLSIVCFIGNWMNIFNHFTPATNITWNETGDRITTCSKSVNLHSRVRPIRFVIENNHLYRRNIWLHLCISPKRPFSHIYMPGKSLWYAYSFSLLGNCATFIIERVLRTSGTKGLLWCNVFGFGWLHKQHSHTSRLINARNIQTIMLFDLSSSAVLPSKTITLDYVGRISPLPNNPRGLGDRRRQTSFAINLFAPGVVCTNAAVRLQTRILTW